LFDTLLRLQLPQLFDHVVIENRQLNLYELAASIHGAHVLLVEDNEINQEVALEFLSKSGLQVTIANHGGEAIACVKRTDFDAVLMDLQMPTMDGFMACQEIRKLPQGKELPIIALSAAALTQDKQACDRVGMNDHVAKPINPEYLIAILLKWIKPKTDRVTGTEYKQTMTQLNIETPFPLVIPGFDLPTALQRMDGNHDLLSKLLLRFAVEYTEVASQIDDFLLKQQVIKAADLLHRVRGAAANLGAIAVAETRSEQENRLHRAVFISHR
jgi:CheY-like chemotaxis protein